MAMIDLLDDLIRESREAERDDVYLPDEAEIRAACQEIQASWTESERARRSRGQAGRVRGAPTASSRRFVRLLLDSDDRAA